MQTLYDANRPISVVMVTSGGSGYPTGGDSTGSLDGSTFYTKVRGDGTTTAIIKLVISGGAIQEFGDGATKTSIQNGWCRILLALVDLAGTNIYTDANASTLISGSTLTTWNSATGGAITPSLNLLVDMVRMTLQNLGVTMLWFKESLNLQIQDATQVNDFDELVF